MPQAEIQSISNAQPHAAGEVQLYKFPYKRVYDSNGNLTSIPTWVKKVDGRIQWGVRKTNFVENAAMYLNDHPFLTGLLAFLETSTLITTLTGKPDVGLMEAGACVLTVIASGLAKEMEAKDQGVTPQFAKPVKIAGL
jgi:hypothetical protein